jgi:hypothetical protein
LRRTRRLPRACLNENPYFSGEAIEGGRFFNAISAGHTRGRFGADGGWHAAARFVVGARVEALVLVFLLALETRRFFETDLIGWRYPASEAEKLRLFGGLARSRDCALGLTRSRDPGMD